MADRRTISRLGRSWRAAAAGLLMAATGAIQPGLAMGAAATTPCQSAGTAAEREFNLPPGVLLAIGVVESGRWNPTTGRVAAWPWTIEANGAGQTFESLAEAVAATRALQQRGVTSIDVGCFQINLRQHPAAFTDLEEAFDPQSNATYAARFLSALHARTGSWENAVAAYHSASSERGSAYRDRVLAALTQANMLPLADTPPIERVMVWTPPPVTNQIRVWTPNAPGLGPSIISFGPTSSSLPTLVATLKITRATH